MDKVTCKECDETGHLARDCPNKKCRNCEQPGHHSRDCTVHSPTPPDLTFSFLDVETDVCKEPRNPKNVECRNCFQMGHFSRDCTEPRTDTGRVCYNCKSPGPSPVSVYLVVVLISCVVDHMSRECPHPRSNGDGNERRTGRDTLSGLLT